MIAYIPYGKIILVNTEWSYTDSRISCLVFDIICIVSRPTRDYVTVRHYLVTSKMGYVASALTIWNTYGLLIPHPVASEHRWLVKAPRWIHSVPDVSGGRSWRCGCQARL